jgi:Tfp pilus assembly protein FimV
MRGGRSSLEPNPFVHGNRGRGGPQNRGNKRNFSESNRYRGAKQQFSGHKFANSSLTSATDLSQKPAADAIAKVEKKKKKKKRKTNTLGLTPGTEEYQESEEEDDVDEEAKLAASILSANVPE